MGVAAEYQKKMFHNDDAVDVACAERTADALLAAHAAASDEKDLRHAVRMALARLHAMQEHADIDVRIVKAMSDTCRLLRAISDATYLRDAYGLPPYDEEIGRCRVDIARYPMIVTYDPAVHERVPDAPHRVEVLSSHSAAKSIQRRGAASASGVGRRRAARAHGRRGVPCAQYDAHARRDGTI